MTGYTHHERKATWFSKSWFSLGVLQNVQWLNVLINNYSLLINLYNLGKFIDLSIAFDKVNHTALLKMLPYYGLENQNLR